MRVLVIDGQGGGMGKNIVASIREHFPAVDITAVGTNSTAANVMLKAGATRAATGENAAIVASRKADFIIGPLGIVLADSLLGEITPAMAAAVAQSAAQRILLPVERCDNHVVGVEKLTVTQLIERAVDKLAELSTAAQLI